jgi:hypothetical protein
MFLLVLFLIKIGFVFKNPINSLVKKEGLTYDNTITLQDAVNKDTDADGVPDWEENLYGLDPTKKETTPGTPDNVAIQKLISQNQTEQGQPIQKGPENLTQTDKFSQELMATVTTLSQNGGMDQATANSLGASLAQQIQNTTARKVYTPSDIKINNNPTYADIRKYNDAFSKVLYQKESVTYTATDVLQEFMGDGNSENVSALSKLDPIIQETNKVMNELLKISVPQSLATLHLSFINAIEKLVENLNDLKLYDKDPIVALGAISQYETNSTNLQYAAINLTEAYNKIEQKLRPKQ